MPFFTMLSPILDGGSFTSSRALGTADEHGAGCAQKAT
jgi:hypothetical protein